MERSLNSFRQQGRIYFEHSKQEPDIKEIFHPGVLTAELNDGFKFLRDHQFTWVTQDFGHCAVKQWGERARYRCRHKGIPQAYIYLQRYPHLTKLYGHVYSNAGIQGCFTDRFNADSTRKIFQPVICHFDFCNLLEHL